MKKIFFGFFALAILNACDSAGSGVPVDIPDITIDCDTAKCTTAASPRDAVVTLSLSGCAPDQIDLADVAIATFDVTCNGGGCSGTSATWRDGNGTVITQVESNRYDVCGWIDIDNDAKDDDDAFSESSQSIIESVTALTLSDWDVIYTFSRAKVRKNN